jgi:hypothetical protein
MRRVGGREILEVELGDAKSSCSNMSSAESASVKACICLEHRRHLVVVVPKIMEHVRLIDEVDVKLGMHGEI